MIGIRTRGLEFKIIYVAISSVLDEQAFVQSATVELQPNKMVLKFVNQCAQNALESLQKDVKLSWGGGGGAPRPP